MLPHPDTFILERRTQYDIAMSDCFTSFAMTIRTCQGFDVWIPDQVWNDKSVRYIRLHEADLTTTTFGGRQVTGYRPSPVWMAEPGVGEVTILIFVA